jgi:hypothetical protein
MTAVRGLRWLHCKSVQTATTAFVSWKMAEAVTDPPRRQIDWKKMKSKESDQSQAERVKRGIVKPTRKC